MIHAGDPAASSPPRVLQLTNPPKVKHLDLPTPTTPSACNGRTTTLRTNLSYRPVIFRAAPSGEPSPRPFPLRHVLLGWVGIQVRLPGLPRSTCSGDPADNV